MSIKKFQFCIPHMYYSWKDKSNPFRTDERFLVNCVPTLIELNSSGRRLVKDEEFVSVSIIVKFLS